MKASEKTDKKQSKPWLFKPGESGNPDGRPKGVQNFTTKVRAALEQAVDPKNPKKGTKAQALVDTITKLAIAGDDRIIKIVWNYLDGMPKQSYDANITGLVGTRPEDLEAVEGKIAEIVSRAIQSYLAAGQNTRKQPRARVRSKR